VVMGLVMSVSEKMMAMVRREGEMIMDGDDSDNEAETDDEKDEAGQAVPPQNAEQNKEESQVDEADENELDDEVEVDVSVAGEAAVAEGSRDDLEQTGSEDTNDSRLKRRRLMYHN